MVGGFPAHSRIALVAQSALSQRMDWAIDVTHTAHTRAQTGIQQVCRDLVAEFSANQWGLPIVHDPYAKGWRHIDRRERLHLRPDADTIPGIKRGAAWSLAQKGRGLSKRLLRKAHPSALDSAGLLVPEIFDPARDAAIRGRTSPTVAFFHDAVPLLFPHWTPAPTVQRFPAYLASIATCDLVLCPSSRSGDDLRNCLRDLELPCPPIRILTLGIPLSVESALAAPSITDQPSRSAEAPPIILMVGSIEARKNHLAALEACETLWQEGCKFHLHLIGMLNRQTGLPAARLIEALVSRGYPLSWKGSASQRDVLQAYRAADLFLYPSLYEGFGIPVLEARAYGLPIITTNRGALQERLDEGGCLETEPDSAAIAHRIKAFLLNPEHRKRLAAPNLAVPTRSMREVASDLHRMIAAQWPSASPA